MVGKGSVCNGLLDKVREVRTRESQRSHNQAARAELCFSVSYTTRDPRPSEINGTHYHFVTKDDFERMIAEGHFLEYAEVHGQYYGTSLRWIEDALREGKDVLLDIDVQGKDKVIESGLVQRLGTSMTTVMVLPGNMADIEARLRKSDRNDIEVRLAAAQAECDRAGEYSHQVINREGALNSTIQVVYESFYGSR
ncbi:MAG TPA: guanylate kinase [Candidatus Paceibacterota bacterium]